MSSKGKNKAKKKPPKWKYNMGTFAVVKFYEADRAKLFDSIPDLWFANEEKTSCYWPPKSKKSTALRAMNQDLPEDDWDRHECEVVSEGHATYSIACNIVREKAAQNYNTSSADEHIQEAQFRRQHPGLIHNGQKCFEDIFAATKATHVNETNRSTVLEQNTQKICNDMSNKDKACNENHQSSPAHSDSRNIHLESYSESQKHRSLSSENLSGNYSQHKNDNHLARSHSQIQHNDTNNKTNENRDGNHQIAPAVHVDSRTTRSRSRSTRSPSRRPRSPSRNTRSPSRSTRSSSRRTRSGSRRTRSGSRRTRSGSRRSRSRSRNNDSQQPRSDHSESRSNQSLSNYGNNSTQHDNRSRSRSDASVSRSKPRMRSRSLLSQSRGTKSRSHDSAIGYTHKRSNRSPGYIRRSESSRHRLQSEKRKGDRRRSKSPPCTVQKTNPDKPARNYRSNRSSVYDGSGRYYSNRKTNTQRHDFDHNRGRHCATEQPESQKNNLPVSPQTRNRLRVEEMVRLHQLQRAAKSSTAPRNSQAVSSSNLQTHRTERQHHRQHDSAKPVDKNSSNDSSLLQSLLNKLGDIERIVTKNDRRFVENDRRLTRLEVTVNKSFIVLGDMSNAINSRALMGNTRPTEDKLPKGFRAPKMPISRLRDLIFVNDNLANKEFFRYLVNCEKEFCCSSSSTDTATMTSYLRRFIDIDLRASIVLKDLKGQQGMTLYHNFYNVYLFLIETMKEGYPEK